MSTIEAPREQEQVVGTLVGIVAKGVGKWQAVVLPDGKEGTNHTRNLWTDDANLIASLQTMLGQRLAYLCNASHWKMNDGTPVRSLWIETVGAAAAGSPAMQGPTPQPTTLTPAQMPQPGWPAQPPPETFPPAQAPMPAQPFQQAIPQDVKEQRIHRQTASKVAAIMLTHVAPEERTMATLFVLAERLVAYYNEGMPHAETLDQLMQRAMPQEMEPTPPFQGDDDIPF